MNVVRTHAYGLSTVEGWLSRGFLKGRFDKRALLRGFSLNLNCFGRVEASL